LNSVSYSQFTSNYQQCELSKNFIEKYKAQDFEGIYAMFDSTMKAQIPIPTLKQIQTQLFSQVGEIDSIIMQNCTTQGEYITCINTVHFEKGDLNFLLSYNKENQVAGFYIQPVMHKSNYTLPEYADTTKFERKSLKFGKKFPLDAELTLPTGKKDVPCIIFVHGSGPNDMDETIYDNKPFKDLAYGLSSNGIATFRYNKRTNQYSKELSKSMDTMTLNSEVLEDVVLAYKFVAKQKGINSSRIYILGHSLGGYVIPKIAELLPKAAGFIILAGSARPLEDLLIDQTQYISELPNSQITQEQ
jgi:predicted esterase